MVYVEIENNYIKNLCCGDYVPKDCIEVEEDWAGRIGEPLSFYDENLKRKSNIQLIKEGLLGMPIGYKFNEDKTKIILLNQIERIEYGLDKLPNGFKIENDKLVEMSIEEKFAAGLISQKEIDEQEMSKLKEYLCNTDYVTIKIMEGAATVEEYSEILEKRKEARERINKLELQNT